jgi:hypothetical protein
MAKLMTEAALHALSLPTDQEVIAMYLRRHVLGKRLPETAGVIHEDKAYDVEPKQLALKYPRLPKTHNRFFFTTCKRQKAGKGHKMSRH